MVVIFARTRRAMLGKAFRYLQHLHMTSENFFRATFKKFFRWKLTFSKIFVRILSENWISKKIHFFLVLIAYLLIYASYDHHFLRTRKARLGEAFRYLELIHIATENFSRVTFIKVFIWKNTLSYIFVRIFWELNIFKNSIFSLLVAYLLIYASYDHPFFTDA